MEIKYLSDAKGTITGVFIEIGDWKRLQQRYSIPDNPPAESGDKLQQ